MEEPRNCQPSATGFLAPTLCMGHLGSFQDVNLKSDRSDDVIYTFQNLHLPKTNRLGVVLKYRKYTSWSIFFLLWWVKKNPHFFTGNTKNNPKKTHQWEIRFFFFAENLSGKWLSTSAGPCVGARAGTGDVFDKGEFAVATGVVIV